MSGEFTPTVRAALEERSQGLCECCGAARAVHAHHRRARGLGGTRRKETGAIFNALHVCHVCHLQLIESHRTFAILVGWLVPQEADPELMPVLYRGEYARLTAEGGVEFERQAA